MGEPVGKDQIAVEELKFLQAIIARQDEFKARTKNWAVTVVAALTTVYLSGQAPLGRFQFLVIVGALSLAFMVIEALFGSAESHAEDRVRVVEHALREPGAPKYDGPMICDSMLQTITAWRLGKAMLYARTWVLYLFLILSAFLAVAVK
jgi:uncharacterized membrane protein